MSHEHGCEKPFEGCKCALSMGKSNIKYSDPGFSLLTTADPEPLKLRKRNILIGGARLWRQEKC